MTKEKNLGNGTVDGVTFDISNIKQNDIMIYNGTEVIPISQFYPPKPPASKSLIVDGTNGNDSTGSWTLPFKTLQGAFSFIREFHVTEELDVNIKPGTYDASYLLCHHPDLIFIQADKGVDAKEVILTNANAVTALNFGNLVLENANIASSTLFGNIYISKTSDLFDVTGPKASLIGFDSDISKNKLSITNGEFYSCSNLALIDTFGVIFSWVSDCNIQGSSGVNITNLSISSSNEFFVTEFSGNPTSLEIQNLVCQGNVVATLGLGGGYTGTLTVHNYPDNFSVVAQDPSTQQIIGGNGVWQCIAKLTV